MCDLILGPIGRLGPTFAARCLRALGAHVSPGRPIGPRTKWHMFPALQNEPRNGFYRKKYNVDSLQKLVTSREAYFAAHSMQIVLPNYFALKVDYAIHCWMVVAVQIGIR